ncbi:hypothetical protein CSB45_03975 [candidate division KSB3 bacterium]|uniref:Alpha-2-macroglobulin n=1 Tax=candidate division KSB3 bacterium TaxID=2044937 RepID=A0A2G6E863_9BACT|nr:MAG: hypothetical protein CSB45_03975 [candidate division KSB3 bacterium]PIE30538.1 MAG: hypothetical protein CSA57_02560 [candidate division KSB3 bacterium]
MKKFYVFMCYGIALLGAFSGVIVTALGDDTARISVDSLHIRAMLQDSLLKVTLPLDVDFRTADAARYEVSIAIEDLKGTVLGSSSASMNIVRESKTIMLPIHAEIDPDSLAAYVIHYRLSGKGERLEGKKSLFYAVRQIETKVLMQRRFYAASRAAVRIVVTDPGTQNTVAGANVEISLGGSSIFQGETDAHGTLDAQFTLPKDAIGNQECIVTVEIDGVKDIIRQSVQIEDIYKILLTTDKPLYQPGQVIHIRSLALRKPDLLPAAEEDMIVEVEDAKGNKVFKQRRKTNQFGISSADFQLAHELNEGSYRIRAIIGENIQEKHVTVERYVLPKFNVLLETDKRFYQPGDSLKGEVHSEYFFGKAVSGATVVVTLSKFDTGFEAFSELKGKTDDNGYYQFETALPDYFVGRPLEQGNAFVSIEVSVTDGAEHEESKTITRAIAAEALNVVVIPESGTIVPGVENLFYAAVSYPDGRPAEVSLKANFSGQKPVILTSNASGIAELRATPHAQRLNLSISAKDTAGARVSKNFSFDADSRLEQILLRTDQALYQVGDTMAIDVFAEKSRATVYLDLIKDGQTFLTKTIELTDGRGTLDLEASVSGSLQLHAYQILSSSDIIRDTKLVYVDSADELAIEMAASKERFLPGEEARIDLHVSDGQGRPILAALGVSIVDESVFALQEMQPGLEKIYFMLEKELMTPRYEIHAYSMEDVVLDTAVFQDAAQRRASRRQVAKVLLASAEHLVDYDIVLNSFADKLQNIRSLIQEKIMEDFRKISLAMNDYSRKKKRFLTKKEGIEAVLKAAYLQDEDMLDPWGNPYRVQAEDGDFASYTFWCLGPDGHEKTEDDLRFSGYLDLQSETPSFFDWLLKGKRLNDFKAGRDGRAAPLMMLQEADAFAEKSDSALEVLETDSGETSSGETGPRIRQYFPETLYTNPAILTDEEGHASIQTAVADSITTWRLSAMASSLDGMLGSGTSSLTVFQDFFADIDLPATLTQNDRVSIPVALYNYLPETQNVRLKLTEEEWFELVDDIPEKMVTLESGQVDVVYFTLNVRSIGRHKLTVHAFGSAMSDAIARTIEVLPDGEKIEVSVNGRLAEDVEHTIDIPADAIKGASKILVKVYPGIFSQIVEGLDSILRMPSGCFEQTSSTTYPNVLVLDYMKQNGQITPEIQMKAEGFISTGYQRLLSYEVDGGGFEWFGRAPAHKILTAYGLMEFYDMAQVYDIDPNVITRTQRWLISQQEADGSWKPNTEFLDEVASKFADDVMRNTAYISWALLATDNSSDAVSKAVTYIKRHVEEVQDLYTLALIANVLALYAPKDAVTIQTLEDLLEKRQEESGKVWWEVKSRTSVYGSGISANIETSALAALALMNAERNHDTVSKILTWLVESKDSYGTWHSTQATILAMKTMLSSLKNAAKQSDGEVTVLINDEKVESFVLTSENSDVMRLLDVKEYTCEGANRIALGIEGDVSALYQIVGRFYLPWKEKSQGKLPMEIDVSYDKSELAQNDMLTAKVVVKNNRPDRANMIVVDLGVPPGFEVQVADLNNYVASETISRFSLTGRQIIVYLDSLDSETPVEFSYRLKAKFPLKAKTPPSAVYEYYNPDVKDEVLPQELTVSEARES